MFLISIDARCNMQPACNLFLGLGVFGRLLLLYLRTYLFLIIFLVVIYTYGQHTRTLPILIFQSKPSERSETAAETNETSISLLIIHYTTYCQTKKPWATPKTCYPSWEAAPLARHLVQTHPAQKRLSCHSKLAKWTLSFSQMGNTWFHPTRVVERLTSCGLVLQIMPPQAVLRLLLGGSSPCSGRIGVRWPRWTLIQFFLVIMQLLRELKLEMMRIGCICWAAARTMLTRDISSGEHW